MEYKINEKLREILEPAYAPCKEFGGICQGMSWRPLCGHAPRGYFGALGKLEEVELILVFAEPGNPYSDEEYEGVDSVFELMGKFFHNSQDKFHCNVRTILDYCWHGLCLEEQFSKVWMTESVLCSAQRETGSIHKPICTACGFNYLKPQIELFPNALVAALGNKAQDRLSWIGVSNYIDGSSPAEPEGNKHRAKESWKIIAEEVKKRSL